MGRLHEVSGTRISERLNDTVSWIDSTGVVMNQRVGPSCAGAALHLAQRSRTANRYRFQRNYQGHYWCAGTGGHVWYESMTEYSSLMLLDHTKRLIAVASQPAALFFADGSTHYPDFFALHESGDRVMYDVRPAELIDDKAAVQFAKTADLCERIGWGYELLHGAGGIQRYNLEWITAYRHPWNRPDDVERVRLCAFLDQPRTLNDAARLLDFKCPARHINLIYHLMWTRELTYDENAPLGWSTRLRRNQNE